MRFCTSRPVTVMLLAAAATLAGCGGNEKAEPTAVATRQPALTATSPQAAPQTPAAPVAAPAVGREVAAVPDLPPAPPKDARFTIFCARFTAANHVKVARDTRQNLAKATGMPDFYVIHQAGQSELYYGYYRAISKEADPAEARRAMLDKRRLEVVRDQQGARPFARAVFVPLEQPDPAAPAEWNLANASGHWSLQIAAFRDHPDRKQAAVESVRAARAQGIPAYYHHGQSISSVTVGSWPEEAVRGFSDEVQARSTDPGKSIFVSTQQLPQGIRIRDERGREMAIHQPSHEIIDNTLSQAMQQYPTHSLNGYVEMVNGKARGSFLVRVPQAPSELTEGAEALAEESAPQLVDPLGRRRSTTGLRSLE